MDCYHRPSVNFDCVYLVAAAGRRGRFSATEGITRTILDGIRRGGAAGAPPPHRTAHPAEAVSLELEHLNAWNI